MKIYVILIILTIYSCTQAQVSVEDTMLDLSGKHLKRIPDSVFEMNNLTYLDLGSSNVIFYPPLSGLVDTNANEITVIPEKIGELKNLKTLILNSNRITTLPSSITQLINLEVLDLSINKDLDIIKELNKLKQLSSLKVLKIVDAKLTQDDLSILRSTLGSDTKVIVTVQDYLNSIEN